MASPRAAAEESVVRAEGLSKSYLGERGPQDVLRGLDLELQPGELVAILGPSGSGKSTLLNLLGLMDHATSGRLLLFGREAEQLGETDRARLRNERIGFVFQFDSLLHEFNVLENILLPGLIQGRSREAVEKRARFLLHRFGLQELEARSTRDLSGGERQRVALARGLLNKPELILADEPTGNLDRQNGEMVFSDLRRLADEFRAAVVLVTHNERSSAYAHRTLRLLDGRLQALD